jgi:hypothetical protein
MPTSRITADWEAPQAAIAGRVVLPGAPDCESARKPSMARFENTRPAAVALCSTPRTSPRRSGSTADHLQTAIRSGGHSVVGRSWTTGIVIGVTHGLGEAGDRVDGHGLPSAGAKVAGLAGDLRDLGGVGEAQAADADGFEGAQLHATVAAVAGAVQRSTVVGLLDILIRNSAASRWVCRASAVLLHTTRPYLTNRTYRENAGALPLTAAQRRAAAELPWYRAWLLSTGRAEAELDPDGEDLPAGGQ